jgi:hypothetical protein
MELLVVVNGQLPNGSLEHKRTCLKTYLLTLYVTGLYKNGASSRYFLAMVAG